MSKMLYYNEGERIIQTGNIEQRMYIIIEGSVSIVLVSGKDRVEVAKLEKGDFFGEISLFNEIPRSATAIALTDVKLVYIDSKAQLNKFLVKNPAFAAKMVNILALRLSKTDEILIGKISEINRLKVASGV